MNITSLQASRQKYCIDEFGVSRKLARIAHDASFLFSTAF